MAQSIGSDGGALVVGADGLIGRGLVGHLRAAGCDVSATSRRPAGLAAGGRRLDLAEDVGGWQPPVASVAYLCAAVTSLERCRERPTETAWINVDQTVSLGERLVARGMFVLFLSTSLVYDGTRPRPRAEEPRCPRTEYGRQKAEAEARLLALGDSIAVVRLSKVLGPGVSLLEGWIAALREGRVIHPFSDLVVSPVALGFAVEILRRVATQRLAGIIQVSAAEDATYAEMARRLALRLGAPPELVRPITSAEAHVRLEAIPSHTTLDTTRLRSELQTEPPSVWSALDAAVTP